ncbi:MAG: A/G-specific adenine glycosylase [Flavobacteriaceae bacterium]|nr:A/G-specific adenine glycosylase [Formosa sp.]MDG2498181.1 A/G-specific adenine glycosylase [Flavobacteriaceae bacterium]
MNFHSILTSWYSVNKRILPWRSSKNPYNIWLSEIILQQTQVKQGQPYYEAFLANYPTVKSLAEASETEVLNLWQGLGYYSRARNLHFTAKHITENLNGEFPKNYKSLLDLKGVGDYTASAIASICYEEPVAVVDGNVYRVLSRYYGIDTPINSTEGVKQFKKLAQSLLPSSNFGDYNQAVMEFGSQQCKPQSPNCELCPFASSCKAYATGTVKSLPVKLKKIYVTKKYFNFLVFDSNDHKTSLEQRTEKGIWQQLYQFPLIETADSVSEKEFLIRLSESNIIKEPLQKLLLFNAEDIIHKLSHRELHIKFWILKTETVARNAVKWADINNYPVPAVIERFIKNFYN